MLQLHRQNMKLDALLRQFKNSDEEYLKIRLLRSTELEVLYQIVAAVKICSSIANGVITY